MLVKLFPVYACVSFLQAQSLLAMTLFIHTLWVGCHVGICTWLYVTWVLETNNNNLIFVTEFVLYESVKLW